MINTNNETSEQVGWGHPDKFCDIIANTLRYLYLENDSNAHTAIEVCCSYKTIHIFGEVKTTNEINAKEIKQVVKNIFLDTYPDWDFNDFKVLIEINKQSQDIDSMVSNKELGAGDQGITIGAAENTSPTLEPITAFLANEFCLLIEKEVRKNKFVDIKSDFKVQVSILKNNLICNLSIAHSKTWNKNKYQKMFLKLFTNLVKNNYPKLNITQFYFNKNGEFTKYGFLADSGLTGRKIICDTYGSIFRHGGGSFNGKDATKVDISAALYARYVAKLIIKNKLATKCEVCLSWIIGDKKPCNISIKTFGTEKVTIKEIEKFINKIDFSVSTIVNKLELRKAANLIASNLKYGYFHNQKLTWELFTS